MLDSESSNKIINIAIVILHYNDLALTSNYMENIKSLNWGSLNYKIIIVDNCSPDGSGTQLNANFAKDKLVDVILSKENLGFAKGNNLGISYAYERYGCGLIAVSNNDIQIQDKDFFIKLWDVYNNSSAAVIGPDIFSLNKNIHQSPISQSIMDFANLKSLEQSIAKKLKFLHVIKKFHIYNLLSVAKRKIRGKVGNDSILYDEAQNNVVLHGAFFVLTNRYMEKHPKGLFPGTFLYMEEHILAYICIKDNLELLYDPNLKVFHLDGYTTLKQKSDKCSKFIFELNETLKSCNVFEKLIGEYETKGNGYE